MIDSPPTAVLALQSWESYYVIVGSSAGALTGLQFVVLTLISESGRVRGSSATLAAFGSPNVVHFCAALLVSAIMSAPWPDAPALAVTLALCGAGGLTYALFVLARTVRQRDYRPVLEDWVWHNVLPILAYGAMLVAGVRLASAPALALALVGAGSLTLVFVGIHNAWDTVTYVMTMRARRALESAEAEKPAASATPPESTAPKATARAHSGSGPSRR